MSKIYTVYKAECKATGKVYIGMTSMTMGRRIAAHRSSTKRGLSMEFYKHAALHGFDNIDFCICSTHETKDLAYAAEAALTVEHRVLMGSHMVLNLMDGSGAGKKPKVNPNHKRYRGTESPHHVATVYEFSHPKHGVETCTMYELRTKYSLNDAHVSAVCKGKRGHVGGWTVPAIGWVNKTTAHSTKYELVHPEHGNVTCTQRDLVQTYNMDASHASRLVNGKARSIQGWKLKGTHMGPFVTS